MSGSYWKQVVEDDFGVPSDRPLDDLTAELTRMLGSTDPQLRDGTAYPALATWTDRGVYDDLLSGLGDGMAAGLTVGLGEHGTDSVFRRSFSVLILGECIARDNAAGLLPGRARSSSGATGSPRGTSASATCAASSPARAGRTPSRTAPTRSPRWPSSPHLGTNELTVLLDVLGDRLTAPGRRALHRRRAGPDRARHDGGPAPQPGAAAGDRAVDRPARSRGRAARSGGRDPFLVRGNPEAFLRALYLQLALAPRPPDVRSDLLLVLVDALKRTNPYYLTCGSRATDRPVGGRIPASNLRA